MVVVVVVVCLILTVLSKANDNQMSESYDSSNEYNINVLEELGNSGRQNNTIQRPHIVFVLADDLGYNDIGYHAVHGMSAVKTPHLDTLASEGVKLENYYVQPICSPSRSVLMTGRYLIRYGLQHNVFRAAQPTCLPLNEIILPKKLRELGYATHAIGKWHLGMCRTECLPTRRGFDSFFGYLLEGSNYFSGNKTIRFPSFKDKWTGIDLWEDETPVLKYGRKHSTKVFTRKARDIIRQHDKDRPLFLYLAYKSVHRPLQAPLKYIKKFQHISNTKRRTLAAMVACLDDQIKSITDALRQEGLWENTVFVFSSDNGGHVDYLGGGNNWPLRGGKWTLYEGGVRAVAFVNSPLLSSDVRGTVNKELMHISDWFPTFVDGLGGGNTSLLSKPLDGVNMWQTISKGVPSPREELLLNVDSMRRSSQMQYLKIQYWQNHLGGRSDTLWPLIHAGIRLGDWKLLTGPSATRWAYSKWLPPQESGQREQDLLNTSSKCGRPITNQVIKLYNITADPKETCNVAQRPENLHIVIDLLQRLQRYFLEAKPAYYPRYPDLNANPALHGGVWRPWLDNDENTYRKLMRIDE
ncbi:arylsulfatase B-like [Amphiura filiformis]|uniref:arylsulfatase B-like n=1 Tax=Amphiura filiformis TaxID=82378 RepID=UPI003B2180F9